MTEAKKPTARSSPDDPDPKEWSMRLWRAPTPPLKPTALNIGVEPQQVAETATPRPQRGARPAE